MGRNNRRRSHSHKPWNRHIAWVPKGFLRYQVLKLLSERPMSGAEIVVEVERETEWKPSPGSIYPLLSSLHKKGYTQEVPSDDVMCKRFTLTSEGMKQLNEFKKHEEELIRKFYRMRNIWINLSPDLIGELYKAFYRGRLSKAVHKLVPPLRKKPSKEVVEKVKEILNEAADKLEEVRTKL